MHIQPKGDTGTWFLYAENLIVSTPNVINTGQVILHGGYIPFGNTFHLTPGVLCLFSANPVGYATSADGDACLIGCKYKNQCSLSDSTVGVPLVVATSGSVFLFTYWTNGVHSGLPPLCGAIHVGEIHTDANLGYTVADLDVCYPIN